MSVANPGKPLARPLTEEEAMKTRLHHIVLTAAALAVALAALLFTTAAAAQTVLDSP